MPGPQAGLVMLAGQVADGLTTPVVGLLSDRIKTPIGSRAPWYIIGTLIVIPCFFCIFLSPMGAGPPDVIEDTNISAGKVGFYIAMAALFNVGWASV